MLMGKSLVPNLLNRMAGRARASEKIADCLNYVCGRTGTITVLKTTCLGLKLSKPNVYVQQITEYSYSSNLAVVSCEPKGRGSRCEWLLFQYIARSHCFQLETY